MSNRPHAFAWTLMLAAAAILAITMGIRQALGLFVSPLNSASAMGVASISFAMAVGQFSWGLSQPLFGLAAERWGVTRVVFVGAALMAAGLALTTVATVPWLLVLSIGVLTQVGGGAGSFALLMAAMAQRLSADRRQFAQGFVNAGGSFGQFLIAPLAQALIGGIGWQGALLVLAAMAMGTLPLVRIVDAGNRRGEGAGAVAAAGLQPGAEPLGAQLRRAFADRSYLLLHAGFFTCGFHIAFLVTHLPGEVGLCGLPPSLSAGVLAVIGLFNVGGSLAIGWLGQHYRLKWLLTWMYASRAVLIALFLLAPRTPAVFYLFGAGMGATWLATVSPTAGLVGKLFGTRHLGTLFGLTLLSHQIGAFFGAWLGGLALDRLGNYQAMWLADIALAALAALANLPIREARLPRTGAAARAA